MAPAPSEVLFPAEAFFFGIVPYKLYRATVFAPFLPVFPRIERASRQPIDAMFEEVPSTPFISPAQGMNTEKKGLSGIGSNEAQGFKRHIYRFDLLQIGALRCKTGKKLEKPADGMAAALAPEAWRCGDCAGDGRAAWRPCRGLGSRAGGMATAPATGGRRGGRAGSTGGLRPCWLRAGGWQASETHRR